ncbi:MAG: Hemolysin secretion protein D, chromosomal [Alphaproteobacteria bacterium MarineAlpha9_Bin5]|nr:MAG: Hemolysin secretion protein D, chromosomal [Alphaproteobacteria bacterium MarineAlpha9_Bin6]PPR37615.1 MAG: Hemolysin secretion protein D, chromosomal [Alphaproteobacteria bacterium MarineAlpha9_Bin5]HIB19357.1 HlyD family type I secretion periplasmic adaptor subunit [Alphaproteobacteria bacterium]HIO03229.1 HlyD family type I secretion periplasmic adaptor subunit [Alphaproteobacteria bacterium]
MPESNPQKQSVLRTLAAGDVLFKEGDVGNVAYVVESGMIEICRFTGEDYVTLVELEKGALFGEMALIDSQPRSAMARANGEAVVKEISKEAFLQYLKSSPNVAFNMMQQLAGHVRTANEKLSVDAFSDAGSEDGEGISVDQLVSIKKETASEKKITELLDEFDPDIDRLRNRKIPKPVVQATIVLSAIFVFLIIWSIVSVIDTTVSANGRITTSTPNIDVQANYSSVVKEVLITRGQQVVKGTPLVVFDSTLQEADLQKINNKVEATEARIERLLIELAMREGPIDFEPAPGRQRDIFRDRVSQFQAKINSLDTDIEKVFKEISSTQEDVRIVNEQLAIERTLEEAKTKLFEEELISNTQLLQSKSKRLSVERDFQRTSNKLSELRSKSSNASANKQEYISQWYAGISDELSLLEDQSDSLNQEVIKIQRESVDVTLFAPVDGLILELHRLYTGAVFTEGSVLVTMVPTGGDLAVEFDISPKDITKLVPESQVTIQLEALPAQKHGDLSGRLTYISADTVAENLDGKPENTYRALAEIEEIKLRDTPPNFRLIPGMKVTGKFKVGERRLITYFIYPILRTIGSSFSEP